jgi:uncharacterized membrane protein YGL010W
MKKVDLLLAEYGESHKNKTNKLIHWICVPAIFFVIIGLLWSIPTPEAFSRFNFPVNFGTIGLLLALMYYLTLSSSLTLGMIFVGAGIVAGNNYLDKLGTPPLWLISTVVFVIAWIFQFIGHGIEGKKPSFLKDLQFLLIGPLWLLHFIYKRLNIPF